MEDTSSRTFTPLWIVTGFWFFMGCVLPWLIPAGNNRGLYQTMLITTSVSCYVFWLGPFLMQMNPIVGPILSWKNYQIAALGWGTQPPLPTAGGSH